MQLRTVRSLAVAMSLGVAALGVHLAVGQSNPPIVAEGRVQISEVVATSASVVQTASPGTAADPTHTAEVTQVALTSTGGPSDASTPVQAPARALPGCDVALTAVPLSRGLSAVSLKAPCHANDRFHVDQDGLHFAEATDDAGSWTGVVPALRSETTIVATFGNGDRAATKITLQGMDGFDRYVLQWDGTPGLQLHSLIEGASYGSDGHVWRGGHLASGPVSLVSVGNPDLPEGHRADVITALRGAAITLSVEAEVMPANCGSELIAQTLESHGGNTPVIRNLTLAMPACDGIGEFLVLKNPFQDLKIAVNR